MEAYVWLPPGSYPDMSEALCHMACDIFQSLASGSPSGSPSADRSESSSSGHDAPESSLLDTLMDSEDDVLGMASAYYCASTQGCLDAGGLDDVVALQGHLTGVALEPIERELAVYSPAWAPAPAHHSPRTAAAAAGEGDSGPWGHGFGSSGVGDGGEESSDGDGEESGEAFSPPAGPLSAAAVAERPPTPLHGATWRRPPPPSARLDVRLLDASVQMCAATFATQDDQYQAAAIESMAELLNDRTHASAFSSVNVRDLCTRARAPRNIQTKTWELQ
jgi:hypothetical protein